MNEDYKQGTFTFILLIFCILFSVFLIHTPTASATVYYVNPGQSIQAAVDNASDGDRIIVHDGVYTENIDVNKRLTIQSENGYTTVHAANTSDSVFEVTANYVNISEFTVKNSSSCAGISLNSVDRCNISYNNILNNKPGINFSSSNFNIIAENTISDNKGEAICLYYGSNYNRIVGNNISNNKWGVWIGYYGSASHNIVSDNVITRIKQFGAINVYGNATTNNTILNNTVLNNEQFGIVLKDSRNNTIMNNIASNNAGCGIGLHSSRSNVLGENIVSNNGRGIEFGGINLYLSESNSLKKNIALNNTYFGVALTSSNNNIIEDSTIRNNTFFGIFLSSSLNNTITNNVANSNNGTGICLSNLSSSNAIKNNNASFNEDFGIFLHSSNYNTITGNYASSNGASGISLCGLSSNNNMSNNTAIFNFLGGIDLCNSSDYNIISNNNASFNDWSVYLDSSNYNTIIGNYANSNNLTGIMLCDLSSNNIVINNTVISNFCGIYMSNSSNYNIISNNNASFNKYCGIFIWDLQHFNNITKNTASNNNLCGIFVDKSTNQTVSYNKANLNERGIWLNASRDIKLTNNTANANKISGFCLINSTDNTQENNSASFNTYEGIFLSNSNSNTISHNNLSSNYFGISLYSSNDNKITNNTAESNCYFEVLLHPDKENNTIKNNTWYIQTEMVPGVRLYLLEAVTPSLQTVDNGTNASYDIIAENLGNTPDTFDLVLSSAEDLEISSLDTYSIFLGAGEISTNTTRTITEINITGVKTPLDEDISTNTITIGAEPPQITTLTRIKPSVKTIKLNVRDTDPGIYTVIVKIISRNDNTVQDRIETRTLVPGQVASELINSPRITKSAIIKSSINHSIINKSAIINSSIYDSSITCAVITNSEVVSTSLDDVILEDALVANGNILSGNISIKGTKYAISKKNKISELIIGSDQRDSDLVGITNKNLVINTQNSNTCFNISAKRDYFAASMSVQKSSVPPQGIPEFTNNVGGYVYANASLNLVNSTDWLNISVFYDQNELGALDESTLKLRYFNESARSWEDLPVSGIDLTENYVWCNITHYSVFALLAQPATAPYGGAYSSSRSSNAPHRRPDEFNIPIANPGMNIFNFEWLGQDILEVRTDLERLAIKARVALKKLEKPVEITDPQGIVYGYFEILTNLESENIKSASINFRVSKSWIDENGIATIKIYRYNEDWEELKTEKMKEDNKYFYYTAETSGLSMFVITGEREVVEFTPPATIPAPTVLPTTSPVPAATPTLAPPAMLSRIGLLIIAVIVASAMIVLVAYLLLKGKTANKNNIYRYQYKRTRRR
jgi:PGF-pre-PGF domain-containing protein